MKMAATGTGLGLRIVERTAGEVRPPLAVTLFRPESPTGNLIPTSVGIAGIFLFMCRPIDGTGLAHNPSEALPFPSLNDPP